MGVHGVGLDAYSRVQVSSFCLPAVASPDVADTTKLDEESANGAVLGEMEKESAVSKALLMSISFSSGK